MSPATFAIVGFVLIAALAGVAAILVRYLLSLPRWRKVVLPGFTFYVAGTTDDSKLADALLIAIECLTPIYDRDTILVALELKPLHVMVMETEVWPNIGGTRVGGEAEHNYLRVGPSFSALCHEMIHYLQWCVGEHEDVLHMTWDARIWKADEAYRAAMK